MSKYLIFSLILVVVVLLASAGVVDYVLISSKNALLAQLEERLGVKVAASSIHIALPDSLVIEDLAIGDKLSFHRLTATPSFLGFLKGDIFFNAIVLDKPVINLARNADGTFDYGLTLRKKQKAEPVPAQETVSASEAASSKAAAGVPSKVKSRNFYAESIRIIDGRVEFVDNGTGAAKPFVGHVVDLQLHAGRVSLLKFGRMNFDIKCRLVGESGGTAARLASSGWVDPQAKDMDAQLNVSEVDLTAFRPYYIKVSKKELASGLVLLTAVLKSEKNDLTIDGHLELSKIAFKKEAPPEAGASADQSQAKAKDYGDIALESIMASLGTVAFDFTIHTKMDDLHLDKIKLKLRGNFLQQHINNILDQPSGQEMPDFKQIGKQFKEIGKQFKGSYKKNEESQS